MSDDKTIRVTEDGKADPKPTYRKWLSVIIIVLGLAWIAYILWRDYPELQGSFRVESKFWLAYSVIAGAIGILMTVPVFQLLLRHHGDVRLSFSAAARLLFAAQMLRHLPGRIWGIVYIVNETSAHIPPMAMLRANLDLMIYNLAFSLLVAGCLLLAIFVDLPVAVSFAVAGMACAAISVKQDLPGSMVRAAIRMMPKLNARYAEAAANRRSGQTSDAVIVSLLLTASWSIYLSIWWAWSQTFSVLHDVNIWLLCACYAIAWVVGYVALITPGGIGIREAGFIGLAAKVTTLANLTFVAVFVRLWQIFVELLLFLGFLFAKPAPATDSIAPNRDLA